MLLQLGMMILTRSLTETGFTTSARFSGVYFHELLEVAMVAHVDDPHCSGPVMNLQWVRAELSSKYEVKGRVMVEGNSEIKFLGRIIGRNEHGFHWEEEPEVVHGWPEVVYGWPEVREAAMYHGTSKWQRGPPPSGCLRIALAGRLRMAHRSSADGPTGARTGGEPSVVVCGLGRRSSADGREVVCGWPEVVCGWPEVVCGWPEVVCGWPEVVCGSAGGRLRMAGGRLRMAGGRLRMAGGRLFDGRRSSADGRRSSADGQRSSARRSFADGWRSSADGDSPSRMVNVVRWVRSGSIVAGPVSTPSGRLLDPGPAVVLFSLGLPTTLAFNPHSPQKDERARLGTGGGCSDARARMHCFADEHHTHHLTRQEY